MQVGAKVIVRSNEYDKPYMVCTYRGRDPDSNDAHMVDDSSGTRYWVLGMILPYHDTLIKVLDTLTPKEQWDMLVAIKRAWAEL